MRLNLPDALIDQIQFSGDGSRFITTAGAIIQVWDATTLKRSSLPGTGAGASKYRHLEAKLSQYGMKVIGGDSPGRAGASYDTWDLSEQTLSRAVSDLSGLSNLRPCTKKYKVVAVLPPLGPEVLWAPKEFCTDTVLDDTPVVKQADPVAPDKTGDAESAEDRPPSDREHDQREEAAAK